MPRRSAFSTRSARCRPSLCSGSARATRAATDKDTERNIRDSGEFVVNLVDEALAERMNICAVDFPPDFSEVLRPPTGVETEVRD